MIEVDDTILNLCNSSHPTQTYSVIANNYYSTIYMSHLEIETKPD